MKKYKMRIKDENAEYRGYELNTSHRPSYGFVWLSEGVNTTYVSAKNESYAKELTMEEIDKMPYGFVNQYDLIEVKEQLYYIKLPHLTGEYLYINYHPQSKDVAIDAKYDGGGLKTKFTKQEIEEKFPFYANETCMIKVEDDG